ncbi:MAG: hypothetical protein KDC57_16960 [Saprospiraceae bacterium]|nr:hypothetical protein [Saprospiraceae bacterium]
MFRKTIVLLGLLSLIACTKEPITQIQQPLQITELRTADEVLQFAQQEMPEAFPPEEIARIKSLLNDEDMLEFRSGNTVTVPAGSVDALADAIAEAGEGGTVVLEAGTHTESAQLIIDSKVRIKGEEGSELTLHAPDILDYTASIQPGIITHGVGTLIEGISITPDVTIGGVGIWNTGNKAIVRECTFNGFQIAILNNGGNQFKVHHNDITSSDIWFTNEVADAYGVVIMNGNSCSITNNTVRQSVFGIWECVKGGICMGNETSGNFYGHILCKVPEAYIAYDGTVVGAAEPANHWIIALNNSHDNLYGGFVTIDGAYGNLLVANTASNNGSYDFDFVGDSERFGFLTPFTHDNRGYFKPEQTVKDCGTNNKLFGGTQVDIAADPCM